ncbi:hypothetical protein FACS1894152_7020 [Bacilli bacterium]|nr:hypothetical protein FACS1894152_7020 [Bacilli bacterium]
MKKFIFTVTVACFSGLFVSQAVLCANLTESYLLLTENQNVVSEYSIENVIRDLEADIAIQTEFEDVRKKLNKVDSSTKEIVKKANDIYKKAISQHEPHSLQKKSFLQRLFSLQGNNSVFSGNGIYLYTHPNGVKYEGEWKKGKPDGYGKITYLDGNSYAGEWQNGKESGLGVGIFPNGEQYEGEWK